MRRSIALLLALIGMFGVVGSAAADGSPGDSGAAPAKTLSPTNVPAGVPAAPPSTIPPLGNVPPPPTVAPPTTAWLATIPPPTVAPPPMPSVAPTTATSVPTVVPTVPPTVEPTAGFDGLAFLTEVYAAVNDDPLALIDIAEHTTIINSPADLFVAHLLSTAMSNRLYGGPQPATYAVAAAGKGVSVCADTGPCDTFGDFLAPTGLLESFTVNGVALDDALSTSTRRVVVESLSVDSILCLQSIDGTLSCSVLLSSDGASAVLSWDRAVFTGRDGQQFVPDLAVSAFAPSITDGDFGSAHLVFHGAPLDGDLAIPVVTGVSGTESIVTVPVSALSTTR